jgi:hypothetical protein
MTNNAACGCGDACNVEMGQVCSGGKCICSAAGMSDPSHCGCTDTVCGAGEECVQGKCVCTFGMNDPTNCGCSGAACPSAPMGGAYDQVCNNGTCQCPGGSQLCAPAEDLSPELQQQSLTNVCWPDSPFSPHICADCFTTCDAAAQCLVNTGNDNIIDSFSCMIGN